jgi:lipopolysaccharide biosynthesis glycosyltransferase
MNACVFYAVDEHYLFPTLLSALQARGHVSREVADVNIYCIGHDSAVTDTYAAICQSRNVGFKTVDPAVLQGMHVICAEQFLEDFVEPRYQQLLYLDGDTQIAGSLDDLMRLPLEAGTFMAARDAMVLAFSRPGPERTKHRTYMESIGIVGEAQNQYFNSGVLRINREGWSAISEPTLRLLAGQANRFRFQDQDALNLAALNRCVPLSFKYNFPAFLLNSGLERLVEPVIYHFCANPRPWNGPFLPWGRKYYQRYVDLCTQYPQLRELMPRFPALKQLKYGLLQPPRFAMVALTWNTPSVRNSMIGGVS